MDRHIGELHPAAEHEHAEELGEGGVLVRDQIDDAVRDDDVEALVGERQQLRLALDERDVRRAHLGCRGARLRQHRRRHIDARHVPLFADHLRGDERVGAGAASEIEHALAGSEPAERERVCDAGERLDRAVGNVRELRRILEVLRPAAPGREDEVLAGFLRDGGVGLLDLALQDLDVDLYLNSHCLPFSN